MRALLFTLLGLVLFAGVLAALATLTAWVPAPVELLAPMTGPATFTTGGPTRLRLATWNTGYAGLDRNTDFVVDGGRMSHPRSRGAVVENLVAMQSFLAPRNDDVIFLQEVDRDAARTWHDNEVAAWAARFPMHQLWYATNFRSPFVPYPPACPIGQVDSGIVTLTRIAALEGRRYQFPWTQPWPERLFQLKRCALLLRLPSPSRGKDWCLLNVHLSAFDDGSQRAMELAFIKNLILDLAREGHYVVVGGDWNSILPGVTMDRFRPWTTAARDLFWVRRVPEGWTPAGWVWAYDPRIPSVRTNEKPFHEGENFRTIIDGFLLSPNVLLDDVESDYLRFAHSDHHPVMARVHVGP